jgi:hypothetical protein
MPPAKLIWQRVNLDLRSAILRAECEWHSSLSDWRHTQRFHGRVLLLRMSIIHTVQVSASHCQWIFRDFLMLPGKQLFYA